jgi:hypothetical protein
MTVLWSLVFFSCDDKAGSQANGADSNAMTVAFYDTAGGNPLKQVTPDQAKAMLNHFRTISVRMNKEDDKKDIDSVGAVNSDVKVRRVLRARFGESLLKLLDSNVVGMSVMTGAYLDGPKKNIPTIILRLAKKNMSRATVETAFYVADDEDLCPDPPDCTGEIIISGIQNH